MDVRAVLARWQLQPSKGLGQNFLVDESVAERIVAAAELSAADEVLEIGPGLGMLTQKLARTAGRVVAVELDQRLLPALRAALTGCDTVKVVQGDILALDPAELISAESASYKVVANLPYYITSAVLRHLLEASLKPKRLILTVQREVAESIVARPDDMSLLAVSVQFYGQPRVLFRIRPGSFYPAPSVESAVLQIDVHTQPPVDGADEARFFRVVRAGFSQRRKQLRNALAAGLGLPPDSVAEHLRRAGVQPSRRAQTLTLAEWGQVARIFGEEIS
ncbi:MAG: ribosomal RNA small subunit methyltransferase A [Anaerolineales bacterium]|nr:ribosomal RNA small subunit methyltransferase A [Anaerolineales bacterium]